MTENNLGANLQAALRQTAPFAPVLQHLSGRDGFCMWYRLNEADILVPEGWKDHSVNTFLLPAGPQGGALSFVVTRDQESPTLDVFGYAEQQLILAAKKLPAYQSISRQMFTLSGQPAVQADYTWRTPEGANVYQRQAVVKVNATFLVFTFTSLQQDLQRIEELWQQTIQAIRLRQ